MDQHPNTMTDCYLTCTKTISHCLSMGGEHASAKHINLLMDCAAVCQLAINLVARGSDNSQAVMKLCAEISHRCADECEAMADGDQQMLECAEACRRCAEACES